MPQPQFSEAEGEASSGGTVAPWVLLRVGPRGSRRTAGSRRSWSDVQTAVP